MQSTKNRASAGGTPDAPRDLGRRPRIRPADRVSGGSARPLPCGYGPEAESQSIGPAEAKGGGLNLRETSPRSSTACPPNATRLKKPWPRLSGATVVMGAKVRRSCSGQARGWRGGTYNVQVVGSILGRWPDHDHVTPCFRSFSGIFLPFIIKGGTRVHANRHQFI